MLQRLRGGHATQSLERDGAVASLASRCMSNVCLVIAPQVDANLRADLDLYGVRLKQVNSFAAAHGLMTHRRFDAMVLVVDAVDSLTLRHIRSVTTDTAPPLLVIARDDDDEAQIRALDSGAAGWLSGPVSPRLVACKVRSLIGAVERHERKDPGGTLRFGPTPIGRRLAAAQVHGALEVKLIMAGPH